MDTSSDTRSLALLVLGGTAWLGGEVARVAVSRGHRVTCLARGESGTPPLGAVWVRADRSRESAYDQVAGQRWDAVVDVSWQPDQVRSAVSALGELAEHWVYVSSCSVYCDDSTPDTAEDAPTHEAFAGTGPADDESYGPAKVACEDACRVGLGEDRVLVARAGLIGGYGDRSDRFGYWPARIAQEDDRAAVLVPPLDASVQVVDVRDLASWLVRGAESRLAGVYNAVGQVHPMAEVLAACCTASGRAPRLVEASDAWLQEHGVAPWMGPDSLPLWLPRPEYAGFMARRNTAARAAGLELRPLQDTISAALVWEHESGLHRVRRAGLSRDRESTLLSALAADPAVGTGSTV